MTEIEPPCPKGGAGVGAMFTGSEKGVGISADEVGDGANKSAEAERL